MVNNQVLTITASALRSSFLDFTEKMLSAGRDKLASSASSIIAASLLGFSGSFLYEFAMICIKSLLATEQTNELIKKQLSKLITEPLSTGLEQLSLAETLKPKSQAERDHQIFRYKQALENLDRALSLCQPEERPFIILLRALAAMRLPGGSPESRIHLEEFSRICTATSREMEDVASACDQKAKEKENEGGQIDSSDFKMVGGGLVGMDLSANRLKQGSLLHEANGFRREAEDLRHQSHDLKLSASAASVLAEMTLKSAN